MIDYSHLVFLVSRPLADCLDPARDYTQTAADVIHALARKGLAITDVGIGRSLILRHLLEQVTADPLTPAEALAIAGERIARESFDRATLANFIASTIAESLGTGSAEDYTGTADEILAALDRADHAVIFVMPAVVDWLRANQPADLALVPPLDDEVDATDAGTVG